MLTQILKYFKNLHYREDKCVNKRRCTTAGFPLSSWSLDPDISPQGVSQALDTGSY